MKANEDNFLNLMQDRREVVETVPSFGGVLSFVTPVPTATLLASLIIACLGLGGCFPSGESPRTVSVVAENGVWTWFTDERAVVADSVLYVGHVDTAGYAAVTTRQLGAKRSGHQDTTVRLSQHREVDDHDNPAFLPLDDGRLLAAYSQHHEEPHWYRRVAEGEPGALSWSDEQATTDVGANVTYSNLVQLSEEEGRIFNFFRGLNFDPTMMTSDDGGNTWSAPRHVLESEGSGTRPYVKYASDGEERIDVLYTQGHPRQKRNNVYHLYYQNGSVYESDGTVICQVSADDCLPVPVDRGTLVYDAATAGRAWVWDLEYASDGAPVAAYVAARDSTVGLDLRYRYARYNPETQEWADEEIAYAGSRLYEGENHYSGGIALDPAELSRVYISANVDPASGDSTATGRYEIYRGVRGGEATDWNWTQVTSGSTEDNLRPFVPRSTGNTRFVLWLRGQYESYTEYDTDIVGLMP